MNLQAFRAGEQHLTIYLSAYHTLARFWLLEADQDSTLPFYRQLFQVYHNADIALKKFQMSEKEVCG